MVKTTKSSKLFYSKYPFKITYKRLFGFPSPRVLLQNPAMILGEERRHWWFDLPDGEEDYKRRENCLRFLKGFEDIKYNNSSFTHVYFPTRKSYEHAKKRYKELHTEYHEPMIENLVEVLEKYNSKVELKKSLYHKKYRYKVTFRFNSYFEEKLGLELYEMYKDNANYFLNINIKRFNPTLSNVVNTMNPNRYTYQWRHSPYHMYAIYCLEKIDLEMLTFVAGENISQITKAVLIEEIDK